MTAGRAAPERAARGRHRLGAWLSAGAVAVAALLTASSHAGTDDGGPAPAGRAVLRVLQYNLCGAAAHCWWNAGRSGPGTSVARLAEEAARLRPDLVTVNEICLTQYARLKDRLARAGWRMDGTYASSQDNVPACGRTGVFGSAVLSRGDVPDGRRDYLRFAHTGGETSTNGGRTVAVRRGLLCAHTVFHGHPLIACTAHTNARAPEQLREIRDRLDAFPASTPVVLAGDLNLPPEAPALSYLRDRFVEGRTAPGEATAGGRTIDHAFASRRHFTVRSAGVRTYPESDHALLRAEFTLRNRGM